MTLDNAPDGGVVNGIVPVDDTVAKAHDAAEACNASGCRGVGLRQPVQGFANDFKFTLDSPAKLAIALVIRKAALFALLADASAGYEHIK